MAKQVKEEEQEKQEIEQGEQGNSKEEKLYTCSCDFSTPDLAEFRRHIVNGVRQDGKGVHTSRKSQEKRVGKQGKVPPKTATTGKVTTTTPPKITTNPLNAALFQLVTQTGSIVNTPDIRQSYLCALKYGFPGDITAYLGMAAVDYWYGRGKDPYKEVSEWLGVPEAVEQLSAIASEGGNHGH